jgi:hypothetical protein
VRQNLCGAVFDTGALPVQDARALHAWPAGESIPCDHAGLLLLVPGIVQLGLPELVRGAGYLSTSVL